MKGSGPGGAWTKLARPESPRAVALPGRLDHRPLDIEPDNVGGAMALEQMQRYAAGAAANVEDRLAVERKALDHPVDLIRPARRQIAVAPQRLEEADGGVVIFRLGICRFDHRTPVPKPFEWWQSLAMSAKTQHHLLNIHSKWLDNTAMDMANSAHSGDHHGATKTNEERARWNEIMGCDRHRRRAQWFGQCLLFAARRARRARAGEE